MLRNLDDIIDKMFDSNEINVKKCSAKIRNACLILHSFNILEKLPDKQSVVKNTKNTR